MTGGDPSSSASHIKESAVEQLGWAGGQPQPMGTGGSGGGRSITPKSSANVAVKWVKQRERRKALCTQKQQEHQCAQSVSCY